MGWISLGSFSLSNSVDWKITQLVSGEIFRITHSPVNNQQKEYLKAVVSSAFLDGGINVFNPRRLTYREEKEIFIFYFPQGTSSQHLAFKRLDKSDVDWTIEVEVYSDTIVEVFKDDKTFNQCSNEDSQLTANIPLELLPDNPRRVYAAFVNYSTTDLTLILGKKSSAVVRKGIILKGNGGSFEINNLNLYTGEVTAIAEVDCQLSYVECSK